MKIFKLKTGQYDDEHEWGAFHDEATVKRVAEALGMEDFEVEEQHLYETDQVDRILKDSNQLVYDVRFNIKTKELHSVTKRSRGDKDNFHWCCGMFEAAIGCWWRDGIGNFCMCVCAVTNVQAVKIVRENFKNISQIVNLILVKDIGK